MHHLKFSSKNFIQVQNSWKNTLESTLFFTRRKMQNVVIEVSGFAVKLKWKTYWCEKQIPNRGFKHFKNSSYPKKVSSYPFLSNLQSWLQGTGYHKGKKVGFCYASLGMTGWIDLQDCIPKQRIKVIHRFQLDSLSHPFSYSIREFCGLLKSTINETLFSYSCIHLAWNRHPYTYRSTMNCEYCNVFRVLVLLHLAWVKKLSNGTIPYHIAHCPNVSQWRKF